MRITVIPNGKILGSDNLPDEVCTLLRQAGAEVVICASENGMPSSAQIVAALSGSAAAVAIGGDGTIMHVAKVAAAVGCPVLGINAGHLGFLAGLERNELTRLTQIACGEYDTEERMMLEILVHDPFNGNIRSLLTMNEAVISRGAMSRLVDVSIRCHDDRILLCHGDGVILATPTGSTAYSLSAGGPVVDPSLECMLITPVCSHAGIARPHILPASAVLDISAATADGSETFLTVDGEENLPLTAGQEITVRRADVTARLIRLKNANFYTALSEKIFGRRTD